MIRMKRNNLLLLCCLLLALPARADHPVEQMLRHVEQHNPGLQALRHQLEAQRASDRADNNLPDPEVSYTYTYGSPSALGRSSELNVVQEFDFPTSYASRRRLNRLKSTALDQRYEAERRALRRQARALCYDLVRLHREQAAQAGRLERARGQVAAYERLLENGRATALDVNRLRMEQMRAEAEAARIGAEQAAAQQALAALCGDHPFAFEADTYPPLPDLPPSRTLTDEVLTAHPELQWLNGLRAAADQQVHVERNGWLPRLQVGYRRNTGSGEQFNGFIVGGSLPLFSNRNRVKASRAEATAAQWQADQARTQAEADVTARYEEARRLQTALATFDLALLAETEQLLTQALDGRSLPLTTYLKEMDDVFEARTACFDLECQYYKVASDLLQDAGRME